MTELEPDPLAKAFAGLRTVVREEVVGPGSAQLRARAARRTRRQRLRVTGVAAAVLVASGLVVTQWPEHKVPAQNLGRPAADFSKVNWSVERVPVPAVPGCPGGTTLGGASPVGYGQVAGMGAPVAIVPVACPDTTPLVFVRNSPDGSLSAVGVVDPGSPIRVDAVQVTGDTVTVGMNPPASTALAPTQQRAYVFRDGQFSQVTKYTGTVDANNTTLTLPDSGSPECPGGKLTFEGGVARTSGAEYRIGSNLGIAEFADLDKDGVSEMLTPVTCFPTGKALPAGLDTALFVLRMTEVGTAFTVLSTPYAWPRSTATPLEAWQLRNPQLTLYTSKASQTLTWDGKRFS
ncbi:hypothetical protein Lfu02_19600 [Longispora fulva]|uniref:Uncharacterized protein n=1 Tax=Longispora fulva TaxID=619741 RepID=A0A8J7GIU8_9ACTN|nr:hypothetical protein [Longispora fulva]MBG6140034.1 hypothetical protein [Longispora fulva]GIG57588.1 hypothetical protein Lfu02_19600 [Longispora fulva]